MAAEPAAGGQGLDLCGFPGVERRQPAPDEIEFSSCIGSGVASSVSDKDVSTVIEREHLIAILGDGIPPEDHDFRGISGGPMLTVVEGGRSLFALAGVIYSGPGTQDGQAQSMQGVEIIRARRAHFIRADGSLDEDRWAGTGWF